MSVETRHPEYTAEREAEWALCRAAYDGESAIKKGGERWLPKPSGFMADQEKGRRLYAAYKARAQFPDVLNASVGAMIGIIHDQEIKVEMPDALAYLYEDADGQESTLDDFHRRVTRELLVMGRHGILVDAPQSGGDPYLTCYYAPTILNWDREFFVIDESHMARTGFEWAKVKMHRVLELDDAGFYQQRLIMDGDEATTEVIVPGALGGRRLNTVPFVVAGAKDLGVNVETPPLVGVARAALAMYQLSADYRHQLFMSGQETLVVINGDPPSRVGAGVVHSMKGSADTPPDMKYVGPSCIGIDKHLEAIEHNRDAAVQSGARLFEQSKQADESGMARKMRFRSETANLQTVADASCAALEKALRYVAEMKGLDRDSVIVTPPEDLLDNTMSATEAAALWQIARDGGISYQTFYENIAKGGLTNPERDHDDEFALIDDQAFARQSDLEGVE